MAAYDAAVAVWNELRDALDDAVPSFHAAQLEFFHYMCTSMKVPAAAEEALAALAAGHCVVIGLQRTGEAASSRESASPAEEILLKVVDTVRDSLPKGDARPRAWAARVKAIGLPPNPLDALIGALGGADRVSEMTGRASRRVLEGDTWRVEVRHRGNPTPVNLAEKDAFMDGRKMVCIISDACSSGLSLHADMGAANQALRVHITLDAPWAADKFVQQLGRTHRSNQRQPPRHVIMPTTTRWRRPGSSPSGWFRRSSSRAER